MYADAQTAQGTRLKFARICVEIDASKPLTEEFFLKPNPKGSESPPLSLESKLFTNGSLSAVQVARFLATRIRLVLVELLFLYKQSLLE